MNGIDRIRKAHVAIMSHKKWCAYSALLACGTVKVDDACPTAYTDGWNVTYGSKFINGLNEPKLRLLVLHENTHKAYRHMHIYKDLSDIDRRTANIAMDHFVNLSIMDTDDGEGFVEMPECGVKPDPKYRGWSVKQIFDDIYKKEEGGDGDESEKPDDGDDEGNNGDGGGMDDHDWDNASGSDPKDQQAQAEEIERAVRQGEILRKKMQGKGSGNANGMFDDLLKPKVDWRAILRQFLTVTCTATGESSWARTNRRLLASSDVYMPGDIGKTARHLVIGFDTSGSCFNSDEMTMFVSELNTIVKTVKPKLATVLYVDSEINGSQTFRNGQIAVHNIKPKGGGGTDMTACFRWCTENGIKPDAMIILTDGYTPYGTAPGYPVLWAMTTDVQAPYGLTINIKD